MSTYALSINGTPTVVESRVRISTPSNGMATLTCQMAVDAPSAIPALNAEIVLTEDGTPIFGGVCKSPRATGIAGHPTASMFVEITANDYNQLADRRYILSQTFTAGTTLKSVLVSLVSAIPGATLSGSQVDGPTLAADLVITGWKVRQVLDQLSQLTGYLWRINHAKVLSMVEPGSVAAPFDIAGNGDVDGDVTTQPTRDDYANRVVVIGPDGLSSTVEDAAQIAANGPWEFLAQSPDTLTQDQLDALAAAILATKLPVLTQITYTTLQAGLEPGQTQTINLPLRGVNNTFLITQVETEIRGAIAERKVTAIEGLVYKTGWREKTRDLFSGSGSGAATLPGVGITAGQRYFYFLGGNGADFVESPTPTWVDASPMQVQVNTVARGTTSATITARLRALNGGVTVQARLFDVSANVPITGTSAVVTNTQWETVTWTVSLTPGSHYYKLQLLSGSANEPVGAMAYLE